MTWHWQPTSQQENRNQKSGGYVHPRMHIPGATSLGTAAGKCPPRSYGINSLVPLCSQLDHLPWQMHLHNWYSSTVFEYNITETMTLKCSLSKIRLPFYKSLNFYIMNSSLVIWRMKHSPSQRRDLQVN